MIMGILVFRAVPVILANNSKTTYPENTIFSELIDCEGILIKKEYVIKAIEGGILEQTAIEGKRMASGSEILTLHSNVDSDILKDELEQLNKAISSVKEAGESIEEVVNEDKDYIVKGLIDDIQARIKENNYENIYILRENLSYEMGISIDGDEEYFSNSLDILENKKDEILNRISSSNRKYYSQLGGILSYELDGLEEKLSIEKYNEIDFNNLYKSKRNNKGNNAYFYENESLYKIIDNFEWYMVVRFKEVKELKDISENKSILVYVDDLDKEIKGQVVSKKVEDNMAHVLVKFTTDLHDFYNLRFTKVKIIKSNKNSYKIPYSALIYKDNISGVFVKEKTGIVKFKPILILGQVDNFLYIDMGDSKNNIKLKNSDESIKTISLYDELYVNTKGIKEGQLFN